MFTVPHLILFAVFTKWACSHTASQCSAVFHSYASYNQDKIGRTTDGCPATARFAKPRNMESSTPCSSAALLWNAARIEVEESAPGLALLATLSPVGTTGSRIVIAAHAIRSPKSTSKEPKGMSLIPGGWLVKPTVGLAFHRFSPTAVTGSSRNLTTSHQHIPPTVSDTLTRSPTSEATK